MNSYNTKPTKREAARLTPVMASWRTAYTYMKDMADSQASLTELANMLTWEVHNPDGARAQMLTRIHMRLNAMRQRLEYSALIRNASR